MVDDEQKQRIWVFDNPRHRSHIFFRLFSQHPALEQIYHPYLYSNFMGPERILDALRHDEARTKEINTWRELFGSNQTNAEATEELEKNIARVEAGGKTVFGNEHVCFCLKLNIFLAATRNEPCHPPRNPTLLPDWLVDTIVPIFLIRHPILSVVSAYRIYIIHTAMVLEDEDFVGTCSNRYARLLFDYFVSRGGKRPIVVDAEEAIYDTKIVMDKVCMALDIDPSGIKETWKPVPEDEWPTNPIVLSLTKTMLVSSGVERQRDKPEVPDLEQESKKWAAEYGETTADKLCDFIASEIPNYEYMAQFRV